MSSPGQVLRDRAGSSAGVAPRLPAVGVDVVSVSRVAGLLERAPRFALRAFTEAERRHCQGQPQRWAARWAAKEAVRKLAGSSGMPLPAPGDVEVVPEIGGAPRVRVGGWSMPVALSLSHEGDLAVAVAVAGAPPVGEGWPEPLLPVPPGLRLAERPPDGHKGSFGTVAVVGGSVGLSGAPRLAALAAARGGAGLVQAWVPEPIRAEAAAAAAELMVHPLPVAAAGELAQAAADSLLEQLDRASALVIGPGLGTAPATGVFLRRLLERLPCPAVVDADGLNLAATLGLDWRRVPRPLVLTPHPAEMARLLSTSTAQVQADRLGVAARYAGEHAVTLVLKGSGTVVAGPDGRLHEAIAGVVALATGGSGDVLAGLVAALLAQGLEGFTAALAGVTIHLEAGAAVQAVRGRAGAVASDLVEALPAAQERLRRALERAGGGAP